MNFQPELAAKVMDGSKTVTRRLVSDNPRSPWWREKCSLVPGWNYAVCPGRGKKAIGRILIVSVRRERLGFLLLEEARREGFSDVPAFEAAFAQINREYDALAEVWRIEFEVMR